MSHLLISRSPDLTKLRAEGYTVEICAGHLLVHDVPYVNASREIKCGTLVSELTLAGNVTAQPSTHVVMFVGEYPCDKSGKELSKIKNASERKNLGEGLVIDHTFSSKPVPAGKYDNYYHKMTTYIGMLCCHAEAIDPEVTAKVFRVIQSGDLDSPFKYDDTASSRAEITVISEKLKIAKVSIIGLGGTGSYVLDFVAKTPVKEIHIFDNDTFFQHNVFRSPGAASEDELNARPKKVHFHRNRYAPLRDNIVAHDVNIDESNVELLRDSDFVFLCMDGGKSKKPIIEKLEEYGIPFIDVGMGVYLTDEKLYGILRVTTSRDKQRNHVYEKQRIPFSTGERDDLYSRNIQVADLNALNAALAVIKWKKIFGFYADLEHEYFSTYTIDGNIIINEDQKE